MASWGFLYLSFKRWQYDLEKIETINLLTKSWELVAKALLHVTLIYNQKTGVCLVNQYTYDIWNWHCIKENGYNLRQQEKILKCVFG